MTDDVTAVDLAQVARQAAVDVGLAAFRDGPNRAHARLVSFASQIQANDGAIPAWQGLLSRLIRASGAALRGWAAVTSWDRVESWLWSWAAGNITADVDQRLVHLVPEAAYAEARHGHQSALRVFVDAPISDGGLLAIALALLVGTVGVEWSNAEPTADVAGALVAAIDEED